jgi:hypothetical protein
MSTGTACGTQYTATSTYSDAAHTYPKTTACDPNPTLTS